MNPIIIFLVGLCFLLIFSILDLIKEEVSNLLILIMAIVGIVLSYSQGQEINAAIGMAVFYGVGYLLWKFKTIGGADGKLLAALPGFFGAVGFPNLFVKMWIYLILLLIFGILWAAVFKKIKIGGKKKKDEIPFVPVIAICYVLLWVMNIR